MSLYRERAFLLVPIKITGKPKEVRFFLVSSMCDNRYEILFRKQEDGNYSISAGRYALSNFQMEEGYETNLRWAAIEGDWKEVARIIRTGTSAIDKIAELKDFSEQPQKPVKTLLSEVIQMQIKVQDSIISKLKGKRKPRIVRDLNIPIGSNMVESVIVRQSQVKLIDDCGTHHSDQSITLIELAKIAQIL